MELEEIKNKRKKLESDITDLLVKFCNETSLEFEREMEIKSFYDRDKAGSYLFYLKIKNPF